MSQSASDLGPGDDRVDLQACVEVSSARDAAVVEALIEGWPQEADLLPWAVVVGPSCDSDFDGCTFIQMCYIEAHV